MKISKEDEEKIKYYATAISICDGERNLINVFNTINFSNPITRGVISDKINYLDTSFKEAVREINNEPEEFKMLFVKHHPEYLKYIDNPSEELISLSETLKTFK